MFHEILNSIEAHTIFVATFKIPKKASSVMALFQKLMRKHRSRHLPPNYLRSPPRDRRLRLKTIINVVSDLFLCNWKIRLDIRILKSRAWAGEAIKQDNPSTWAGL